MKLHRNKAAPAMLPLAEVCDLFGISIDTGRDLAREGTFPIEVLRIGGLYKCRRVDVETYTGTAVTA